MAKTDTTETKPRVRLSPSEKAQKTFDTAQKRYDKAVAKRTKYDADVAAMDTEVAEAERFLTFAQGSRHLVQDETADAGDVETFSPSN